MAMSDDTFIQLRHIRKAYQEGECQHWVFRDLSIDFRRGESVALLGRSGTGKTTLLNLLSGIDLPDAGEIWIDGDNIARRSETQRTLFRRRHIGFVFQFFNLIPTLTVLENLLLPLSLSGRLDDQGEARALALLQQVDLHGRAQSYPDVLSGGEQQRVAIARALVHHPSLLLADEATGNLDTETGAQVLALLFDMVAQSGSTLIMVTHSEEAARQARRVLSLHDGRFVE
jgi:putative ABC transport system ATP-binding protein